MQLAVWDTLYDGGDGLSSGRFQATGLSTFVSDYVANTLTADLSAVSTVGRFYQSANGANQGLFSGRFAPVPEPASMAVLGIGLAALKRRRAKK